MTRTCRMAIVLVGVASAATRADDSIRLENDFLRVEFSTRDGAITRLTNKRKGLELVSKLPPARQPWALLLAPFQLVSDFTAFRISPDPATPSQHVELEWETRYHIVIKATAVLQPDSDELKLNASAENSGDGTILAFRYPAIQGIGTLCDDGRGDRLLHSTAMGALFFDPFHLFHTGGLPLQSRGMVISRYPNGFHGSSLQMMAYFTEGRGGFYMAAQDHLCTDKDLNFYKSPDGSLSCEIAHIQWDARPGRSLRVDYPVVMAALHEGTWYEAAERYRRWAIQQPWCQRGTRQERVNRGDACRWLLETIGAVGMWWPFRDDIRADIARTREVFGAPLLHLELWWKHELSRQAAQAGGDRFGPFYFPFLALKGQAAFEAHRQDRMEPPANPIAPDWVAMCPAQPRWRELFCESAEDMTSEHALRHHQIWMEENRTGCRADCLYYDIGPCAGIPTHCYATDHVHAPGAGRGITQAHISLFEETQSRASRVRGSYVPVGTECVSEPFVGCLDLYYARNAGFGPDMEVGSYVRQLTWLPDGQMEIVPLFEFVYHQYGPLAMQGVYPIYPWNVAAGDDFFTWAESRSVLWGGLLVTFPVRAGAEPSADRSRFLRELVSARTGFARDFLAYGRMERPPVFECKSTTIDHGLARDGWLRKIRFPQKPPDLKTLFPMSSQPGDATGGTSGPSVEEWVQGMLAIPATPAKSTSIRVASVMGQAYTLGNDRLGILLVNLEAGGSQSVHIDVNPVACGLRAGNYHFQQVTRDKCEDLGMYEDHRETDVRIASRSIVLVQATRAGG